MAIHASLLSALGERIHAFRKLRGWTQKELARRTNRHWTYIGGLERGERNPTLLVLHDLAEALAVSTGELVDPGHPISEELSASRKWRTLNGAKLLPDVIAGVQFVDGEKPEKAAA